MNVEEIVHILYTLNFLLIHVTNVYTLRRLSIHVTNTISMSRVLVVSTQNFLLREWQQSLCSFVFLLCLGFKKSSKSLSSKATNLAFFITIFVAIFPMDVWLNSLEKVRCLHLMKTWYCIGTVNDWRHVPSNIYFCSTLNLCYTERDVCGGYNNGFIL